MSITLIKADNSHSNIISELATNTFIDTYAEHNSEEDMQNYLAEYFSLQRISEDIENPLVEFYLLYDNERAVAYVKLNYAGAQTDLNETDSIEIERIYVNANQKGKGLGKQLIQIAIDRAEQTESKYIWLGVWMENKAAIAFYEKMGFYHHSTHTFKLGDDVQEDSVMRYDIT